MEAQAEKKNGQIRGSFPEQGDPNIDAKIRGLGQNTTVLLTGIQEMGPPI